MNPVMRQLIELFSTAAADASLKLRTSRPIGTLKVATTTTSDTLRLEQMARDCELLLKEVNRKPETETVLKVITVGKLKEMVVEVLKYASESVAICIPHALGLSTRENPAGFNCLPLIITLFAAVTENICENRIPLDGLAFWYVALVDKSKPPADVAVLSGNWGDLALVPQRCTEFTSKHCTPPSSPASK